MISTDEVTEHLRRLSYKNWSMKLGSNSAGKPIIIIDFYAEDSIIPDREILVGFKFEIPDDVNTTDEFEKWLFTFIMRVEQHEAAHFFKRDGVAIDDQHEVEGLFYRTETV
jgi:hypothetical protein